MSLPSPTWQTLQQSADRARQGAALEQAVELYTQALARLDVPAPAIAAMTLERAGCQKLLEDLAARDAELKQSN